MVGLALLLACAEPVRPSTVHFVRGGLLDQAPGGERLGDRWRFRAVHWAPGQALESEVAPHMAECVQVASVDLGDVSRLVASGGASPDTDLSFSPDGTLLAVGTYTGRVLVISVATGQVVATRTLGEGMVRRVAWSPDGTTLYAGEQSPDAMLRALDPATLADRWTRRLADRVGHSPLPAGEDLYGIYTLPGIYGLRVLSTGDLLVAAAHSWPGSDGQRQNRSQLLRLSPSGEVAAVWPPEPASVSLLHPSVDEAHHRLVIPVTRTAAGPAPADLPVGGIAILSLDTLGFESSLVVEPLAPWFKSAYLWNAQGIDGDTVMLGFGDGRVVLGDSQGAVTTTLAPGAPVLVGDVPVAASVGHGFLHRGTAYFLTSGTNIPWGAAAPELRPPSPHPGENTLYATTYDGTTLWSHTGPWAVQGLTLSPDGNTLVVGAGDRLSDDRRDLYGALLFDIERDESRGHVLGEADPPSPLPPAGEGGRRPGEGSASPPAAPASRLLTTCSTEGPVFFHQALSPQGVLALAEFPYADGGAVTGAYRVVLFR